jgi:hypothetical protein
MKQLKIPSGFVLLFSIMLVSNQTINAQYYQDRSKIIPLLKRPGGDLEVLYVNYGAYNYIGCTIWDSYGNIYDLPVQNVRATVSEDGSRIINKKIIFQTSRYQNLKRIAVAFWKVKIPNPNHPLGYVMKGMGDCKELVKIRGEWVPGYCRF